MRGNHWFGYFLFVCVWLIFDLCVVFSDQTSSEAVQRTTLLECKFELESSWRIFTSRNHTAGVHQATLYLADMFYEGDFVAHNFALFPIGK